MYSEYTETPYAVLGDHRNISVEELTRLDETIKEIDAAMQAEDFYDGDREEVERSRRFFERRLTLARHALEEQVLVQP